MAENVKTFMSTTRANTKTCLGVAIADCKTIMGVDNTSGALVPEVAWWKFNDGSGGTAVDDTGNGNDGTITGTPSWNVGSLNLDGTTNFLTIANEANFDFLRTDSFSISGWVNRANQAAQQNLFVKQNPATGVGLQLFADGSNSFLKAFFIDSSSNVLQVEGGVGSFTHSVLHNFILTYDGSSAGAGFLLYVDGVAYATGTGTLSNSTLNNNAPLIGIDSGGTLFTQALVDDFRVFNRALSSGDAADIFAGGPS